MSAHLARVAASRSAIREGCRSSRPLSRDYQLIGVAGEQWLRDFAGAPPVGEWCDRPGGDDGVDLALHLDTPRGRQWFKVDVKTFRRPINLIVEQGKVQSDIYILLGYSDQSDQAYSVGWEWASVIRRMPVKDFGYGVLNHYRHNSLLRRLDDLSSRLITGGWRVEE